MKFLLTGANGFIGKRLCAELLQNGHTICAAVRTADLMIEGIKVEAVGSIDGTTDWTAALHDVDVVVHLAARVHVMRDDAEDPLEAFRRVNTAGTEHLAWSAAAAGVRRLVYVSSIKVNGEETFPIDPCGYFTEADSPLPQDPYGVSKWEAEKALHRVAQETGLEVVIVRPPLVYGAGVKGNFEQMIRVLAKRVPLPLASVCNLRSLVYVGNLVDALILCATHPSASGQIYLVSDGEDVSTPALLRLLGAALGRPARLLRCPPSLLKLVGRLIGRSAQLDRLTGSLRIDSSKIRRELGWRPPHTLQQGLQATAEEWRNC